nr:alpha-amylase family glycosyl hydrolase [Corynebacterium mendelii]
MDYVVRLGADTVVLGPIFASTSHGYDTVDFFTIDPRLGDDGDFDALVSGCRDRGLGLILDGVFNHVGNQHPLFLEALGQGPDGDNAGMFAIDFDHDPPQPANFEGHPGLVEFNHQSKAVEDLVVEVMCHWLDKGATGWRLDAVYSVPAEFWPPVVERVRAAHPEAIIFGEMIHGDYAGYVSASGIDSVTEYELWKAVWSSLKENNFYELQWTLQRHNGFTEAFTPVTFIGNHDTTRIATFVGLKKAVVAAAILFTVSGHPIVYYGDELGWEAEKEEKLGGDDQVRPMYPATPDDIDPGQTWMLDIYRELIALRRNRPWLTDAVVADVDIDNTVYTYTCTGKDDGQQITVTVRSGDAPSVTVSENGHEIFSFS